MLPPLAAELTFIVEAIEFENPGVFGESGAYGQTYALFTCALATATMLGPLISGILVVNYSWSFMTMMLAIFSASGAIPVVCVNNLLAMSTIDVIRRKTLILLVLIM